MCARGFGHSKKSGFRHGLEMPLVSPVRQQKQRACRQLDLSLILILDKEVVMPAILVLRCKALRVTKA